MRVSKVTSTSIGWKTLPFAVRMKPAPLSSWNLTLDFGRGLLSPLVPSLLSESTVEARLSLRRSAGAGLRFADPCSGAEFICQPQPCVAWSSSEPMSSPSSLVIVKLVRRSRSAWSLV